MQGVYNVLTTIKQQLLSDKFVNQVTTGDIFAVDLKKQTIFPLSHIIMNDSTWQNNVLRFNISVLCMDLVDFSKEGSNNEEDVLNTQLAVANRLVAVVNNGDLNDNLFQMDGEASFEPFFDRFENALAGWTVTFDVLIPNDTSSCDPADLPVITCSDGIARVLDSEGTVIATFNVPSGGTASDTIDNTMVYVNNSLGNAVVFGDFKAGAPSVDLTLPDTTFNFEYGGGTSSVDTPTLEDQTINLIYV